MSDQGFLSLFPARSSAAPDHILLTAAPRSRCPAAVDRAAASRLISDPGLRIRSYAQAARGRPDAISRPGDPTGIIFGFGVLIGVLVGLVIVYQVLSTDVADHLREYATFKAMGYGPRLLPWRRASKRRWFWGMMGFVPGLDRRRDLDPDPDAGKITTLPLADDAVRWLISVFLGTDRLLGPVRGHCHPPSGRCRPRRSVLEAQHGNRDTIVKMCAA